LWCERCISQDSDYYQKEDNSRAITKFEQGPCERKENVLKGAVTGNRELAMVIQEKGGRDLVDVLKEVDELFLKAADSAEKVSRILETKKVHYHSSFSESLQGQLIWALRYSGDSLPFMGHSIMKVHLFS
jgi:hypothetical protein